MGTEVRGVLRGLCGGRGWSYGVLWRFDLRDARLLRMEDSYHEEQMETVVDKLRNQVHFVGEGSLGAVAMSGRHQWICSDAHCIEGSLTRRDSNSDMLKDNTECNHQLLSGMKTIVIISLRSIGVVQFGSCNEISEDMEFINQVRCSFQKLENMKKTSSLGAFASVISSGESYSRKVDDINLLWEYNHMERTESSAGPIQSFTTFDSVSNSQSISNISAQNLHVFAVPIISSSSYTTNGPCNSIQKKTSIGRNSYHLMAEGHGAMSDTQIIVSSNMQLHQDKQYQSSLSNNSIANYLNTTTWNKQSILPMTDQVLSMGIQMHGLPCGLPDSYSSIPLLNPDGRFQVDSTLFDRPSECAVPNALPLENSQACLKGGGVLVDYNVVERDAVKSSSQVPLTSPDLEVDETMFLHSREDLLDKNSTDRQAENDSMLISASADLVGNDAAINHNPTTSLASKQVGKSITGAMNSSDGGSETEHSFKALNQPLSDSDLFDGMELDLNPTTLRKESWDDILMPMGSGTCPSLSNSVSECISELDIGSMARAEEGLFPDSGLEQLLDAVVNGNANLVSRQSSVSTSINSGASVDTEHQFSTNTILGGTQLCRNNALLMGLPYFSQEMDMLLPEYNVGKMMHKSSSEAHGKSQVSSWISDSYSMNVETAMINQSKKPEEPPKAVRKRARPGESTRPRPKDRQQIQDRVKELREIVPNGAKCSIDALLDRTIKHMLYLQSVTKYADKLKQADEPKMIGDESGVVLKDNSSCDGGGGGATWAFEVAGQTMVCPIIVEDVNPPGQMLVEMLCEDCGFFLEIADIIRGFGLTILKGVMEIRDSKIWARFLVEANRDVTRMDIFLSLVQLLQQTTMSARSNDQLQKLHGDGAAPIHSHQQPPMPVSITLADNFK